jgi:hypothetical protein
MAIRVVDNKRVDMTEDEWAMFQKIVKSYTTNTNKGEDLFIDLFETNEQGLITILKPPSRRQTSLEVFLFLMSLMQQQHLRILYQRSDEAIAEMKKAIAEMKKK